MFKIFIYSFLFQKVERSILFFIITFFYLVAFLLLFFFKYNIVEDSYGEASIAILIPFTDGEMEKKKDTIFNVLSAIDEIEYIKRVSKKGILEILPDSLNIDFLDSRQLPELYEIYLKESKEIDIKNLSTKAKSVYNDIIIIKKEGFKTKEVLTNQYILYLFALAAFLLIYLSISLSLKGYKKFIILLKTLGTTEKQLYLYFLSGYMAFFIPALLMSAITVYLLLNNLIIKEDLYIFFIYSVIIISFTMIFSCIIFILFNLNRILKELI